MAIDFPNSPSNGTQFTVGGVTWEYDGSVWNVVTSLRTILNGSGAPSSGIGGNGDFYIDTANSNIYGPKTAGAWGSPTSLIGPAGATGATGPAAPLSSTAPDAITPDQSGAAGSSSDAARADHVHEINADAPAANLTASTTNAEGSATSFARSDHSHAITTGSPGTIQPDDAAAEGSSASLARADHTHAIAAAAASSITGSNAEGSSTSFARADHNHALGAGVVGTTQIADGAVTQAKLAEGVGGGGGSGSNAFALFIS